MFSSNEQFKREFVNRVERMSGKSFAESSDRDHYQALGNLVREYVSGNWIQTNGHYRSTGAKQVYYLSIEFLLGRLLRHNLLNLGVEQLVDDSFAELGLSLRKIEEMEADAALGNGGLGRLAACFLDSLASLGLPGHGCGIRYKHGLFEQKIVDGYQVELPEHWLRNGHVWEVRRLDHAVEIPFWGQVETAVSDGRLIFRHVNAEKIMAVPYDMPVVGYKNNTVNTLRLWNAEPANYPSRQNILQYKRETESVSEFLYPDDTHDEGKILRLKQQYFLVAASINSIIRSYRKQNSSLRYLHEKVSIHINDTHPVLAIPELMRFLIDEEGFGWDESWEITRKTVSYTNHTTLSEALERWPVRIFKPLLPRIYMIIEEINKRFCEDLWRLFPGDWKRIEHMAVIANDEVKMAHLAIVGAFSVNGVAKLHTEILRKREMKAFFEVFPEKFNNKTNGITHRRWLLKANPRLAGLITGLIGNEWVTRPELLERLKNYTDDLSALDELATVKDMNKTELANTILVQTGIKVDPASIFDVQIKRLHAYKRQLLNVLHIMHLYNRLKEEPGLVLTPRTFIFGAKASPGYYFAKKVIKLINSVAKKINSDPFVSQTLKVIFLENYRVSLAEEIFPAADVSEQISTASKEASGTGNMKFMMNGALTVGTMDGANVEIFERVGSENIFTFGLSADEVLRLQHQGSYRSLEYYQHDVRLRQVLDQLVNGFFKEERDEFEVIFDSLIAQNDQYFVLRDFGSYVDIQNKIGAEFTNHHNWRRKSLINIAQSGHFASDRTIQEYATEIWKIHSNTLTR
ncbi:glycogen/starch/alpha-glucan phosphorylase [Pseudoneobacillus sp. C159]